MEAVVFGNANLDILCYPVDAVPRRASIGFEQVSVEAGGCGSNVAVGLAALGVSAGLAARIGEDDSGGLLEVCWRRVGVDIRWVQRSPGEQTGVSVGLVDSTLQPRFIHYPGANARLQANDLDVPGLASEGVRAVHVAGFFVLPGLLDGGLPQKLADARRREWLVTLDVVDSPAMDRPEPLWACLPHVDVFLCNLREAWRLTGKRTPAAAARELRAYGANMVAVKLGAPGCWLESGQSSDLVPAEPVERVVDTTGAGDAFAAGLLTALLRYTDPYEACQAGNAAAQRVIGKFGAVAGWVKPDAQLPLQ